MAPIENTQMAMTVGPPQGRGTIPLSTLIDYILQRTYHELTVMAELLPKKSDMERKIDIVQLASRTRQLFIRLLSLVKWANSAGKVDKCGAISTFLDRQALYFVDSADMFAKMSRETLVHGRLPNFSLPCAIDVLTTGSYPRLPTCIRDRIVPPDIITPAEKKHTLTRLSQIIQHRLVTNPLPAQLHNLKIENGRVKFHVDHEFEATLTLMGDSASIPWRLLDIDILVEDPEIGDGKALVHSLQVHYIHQLVQARLLENERPLHDLYNCLHTFCQSLQLEVLFSQAQRLLRERYGDSVRVDEYLPGRSLVLSYWRDSHTRDSKQSFSLQVHCDPSDANRPLQITHIPVLSDLDSARVGQAIKSDHLSVEKLLAQTIEVRSEAKLKKLQNEIQDLVDGSCEIRDVPSVLYAPVLQPLVPTEMLRVTVDILRGSFLVSIAQYPDCTVTGDIERCVNDRRFNLQVLMSELQVWLALRRCEKSLQYLPATVYHTLPIVNLSGHNLENLATTKLFVRVGGQSQFYLVVEAKKPQAKDLEFNYYMISMTSATAGTQSADENCSLQLRAGHMVKLDQFTLTHSQGTKVSSESESPERSANSRKRKLFAGKSPVSNKQMKFTSQFMPELTHVYAMCEERVPFVSLTTELQKQDILHQGIRVDGNGACMALTLINFPECAGVSRETRSSLRKNVLSCTFRLQRKSFKVWLVELVLNAMPIASQNPRENGLVQRVLLQYDVTAPEHTDKVVKEFVEDCAAIAQLYEAVLQLARDMSDNKSSSFVITSYNFKRLLVAYGVERKHTVSLQWRAGKFALAFAAFDSECSTSCHAHMSTQLTEEFNEHRSISDLLRCLEMTVTPFSAIVKLNTTPTPGLTLSGANAKPGQLICNFSIITLTSSHVRIIYRNFYCLDIHCRSNGTVAIRDGAYSLFDSTKVVQGLNPVPSLKAFLDMYLDDTVQIPIHLRRRSTNDDDNPPSPVGIDTIETTFMPHQHLGSPASRKFPPHSPMTPSSNPHTPSSPSSSARMNQAYAPSPATAFQQLSSPPPIPTVAQSPSTTMLGTPSPGIMSINSPGSVSFNVTSPGFVPAPSPAAVHLPSPAFLNPGSVEPPSPFHGRLGLGSPASVPHPSPRHANILSPGNPHTPQSAFMKDDFAKPLPTYPSRILPQRAWAASVPTYLSHEALHKILSPATVPSQCPTMCSPLEKFLGSIYMRRQLQKSIQIEEGLSALQQPPEPGVVQQFKTECLQFRCTLNANTLQMLQLQVSPSPEYQEEWSLEELQILEKYFEVKVAGPPYKPGAMSAFSRLLVAPIRILKDFIQLMRLELVPDRTLKWTLQWCLTFSPASPLAAPFGTPAVVIKSNKILIMFQITRQNGGVQAPDAGRDGMVLPLLYDTTNCSVTLAELKPVAQHQISMGITQVLKRAFEFSAAKATPGDCLLYPIIREMLGTLILPP